MLIPVMYDIRVRSFLPIVEVKAECKLDVHLWIHSPLQIIEKGEKAGGRLLPEEPKGFMKPNMVFFSMIFENMEKAMDFIKSVQNG